MSTKDLIAEAFTLINSFKRHRALQDIKPTKEDKQFHELQMYKKIDELELSLRAIQKDLRESGATGYETFTKPEGSQKT